MKYCYDVPTESGNKQICYTEEELKEIYETSYTDDMSYKDFIEEWITVNWGYRVEED